MPGVSTAGGPVNGPNSTKKQIRKKSVKRRRTRQVRRKVAGPPRTVRQPTVMNYAPRLMPGGFQSLGMGRTIGGFGTYRFALADSLSVGALTASGAGDNSGISSTLPTGAVGAVNQGVYQITIAPTIFSRINSSLATMFGKCRLEQLRVWFEPVAGESAVGDAALWIDYDGTTFSSAALTMQSVLRFQNVRKGPVVYPLSLDWCAQGPEDLAWVATNASQFNNSVVHKIDFTTFQTPGSQKIGYIHVMATIEFTSLQ